MQFLPTAIDGVTIVEPEPIRDERGFFARVWDPQEFQAHGLNPQLAQSSVSWNRLRGTLRGLHLQVHPHAEAKLVRCTAGALFDVVVDMRRESATHMQWVAVELTAQNRNALYIPEGCAHGFCTLVDGTEVYYQMSRPHQPEAARGFRWNDSAFGIEWPLEPTVVSDRDRRWPTLEVADLV